MDIGTVFSHHNTKENIMIYLDWASQFLGVLSCLGLFVQDLRHREVSVLLISVLAGTGLVQHWLSRESQYWLSPLTNLSMVGVIFFTLYLWVRLKSKGPVMDHKIGWGDLAVLAAIACWGEIEFFLWFYALSTGIISLVSAALIFSHALPKNYPIPLAGLWSLCLAGTLLVDLIF